MKAAEQKGHGDRALLVCPHYPLETQLTRNPGRCDRPELHRSEAEVNRLDYVNPAC